MEVSGLSPSIAAYCVALGNVLISLSLSVLIYKTELIIINKTRWPRLQSWHTPKDLNQLMDTERPLEAVGGPASPADIQAHSSNDSAIRHLLEGHRLVGM